MSYLFGKKKAKKKDKKKRDRTRRMGAKMVTLTSGRDLWMQIKSNVQKM